MTEGWREVANAWERFSVEVEEYRELDAERVPVLIKRRGRGKVSGLELAQVGARGANVFGVRDGKVVRLVNYWDRQRALADLGLSPEDGSS